MKILDMHIHSTTDRPDPAGMLSNMEQAGVWGGTVFSPEPKNCGYEQRMQLLSQWCEGYEDRLFPVLWIHPYEPDAIAKAKDAAQRGVAAFKMICDSYYVYERESMTLVESIAQLGKPVIFHSGILWEDGPSSKYNRPLNWEELINIPGLKFSMGHCSWPWYDECIALYGKFLNAYSRNPDGASEMFFDLTPGTPAIYREDLLYKLFHVTYDVPHNILFGTDSTANCYKPGWAARWIRTDNALYDKMGVPQRLRELIYGENFLRFIGKLPKNFVHRTPVPDDAETWSLESFQG